MEEKDLKTHPQKEGGQGNGHHRHFQKRHPRPHPPVGEGQQKGAQNQGGGKQHHASKKEQGNPKQTKRPEGQSQPPQQNQGKKGQGAQGNAEQNHRPRRFQNHPNAKGRNRTPRDVATDRESDIRILPQNYFADGEDWEPTLRNGRKHQEREMTRRPEHRDSVEGITSPVQTDLLQDTDVKAPQGGETEPPAPKIAKELGISVDTKVEDGRGTTDQDAVGQALDDAIDANVSGESNRQGEETEPPIEVVGVHFRRGSKVYYFDPCGMEISKGTHVITQTANGIEYCEVVMGNKKVPAKEVFQPLRPVLRIATAEDDQRDRENRDKEVEAYNTCVECIANHALDMKLVEAELAFDHSKLLFYFISENRVDFRNLVKELAGIFHLRIELRQIGIRDEAKMLGGLGVCGRPFCCSTFLPDFAQVSIKMAKEQNLSLNSAKISGTCGRLMCCLRFEHATYEEELKITPKVDSIVQTADGEGVVAESNPLTGLLKVRSRANPEDALKVYAREAVTVLGYQKGLSQKMLQEKNQKSDEKKQKN